MLLNDAVSETTLCSTNGIQKGGKTYLAGDERLYDAKVTHWYHAMEFLQCGFSVQY